jgi:hypothetical protein
MWCRPLDVGLARFGGKRGEKAITEEEVLQGEPTVVPTDSKWIAGLVPDQFICEVSGPVPSVADVQD